jgi:formate hydrogenlyase subunit 3/multisubunit Na+/H+ antiporter MnhD subunit
MLVLNIGFPPFIGFIREILILKSLILNKLVVYILVIRVLLSCYYNVYLFWCFTGFRSLVFKLNLRIIEPFVFLFFSLMLNFY